MNTKHALKDATYETSCKCNSSPVTEGTILFPGAKICRVCGLPFTPASKDHSVCYRRHTFTCLVCGKSYELNRRQLHCAKIRRTCSTECQYKLALDTKLKRYGVATCVYEDTQEKRLATYHQNQELTKSLNSSEIVSCSLPEEDSYEPVVNDTEVPNKKVKKSNLRKRLEKLKARGDVPDNLSDEELQNWISGTLSDTSKTSDESSASVENTTSKKRGKHHRRKKRHKVKNCSTSELSNCKLEVTEDQVISEPDSLHQEAIQSLTNILFYRLYQAADCINRVEDLLNQPVSVFLDKLENKSEVPQDIQIVERIVEVPREQRKLKKLKPTFKFSSGEERQEFYELALYDVFNRLDEYIPEEFLSTEEHVAVSRMHLCEFCRVPFVAKGAKSTVCYRKHIFRCNVCGKPFEELTRSEDSKTYKKRLNLFCSKECRRKAEQDTEYKLICLGSYNTKDN